MGFDNRALASLIVLVAIVGLLAANRHTRKAIRGLGAIVASKILLPFVGLAVWAAGLVAVGNQSGLWESALLFETVLWFVTPAVPLLYGLVIRQRTLRDAAIDAAGPAVFLGVFVGLSTFSLGIELLIAVSLTVILPLLALTEARDEYAVVRRSLQTIVGLIGLALILQVVISIASDWDGFDKVLALRALALPVWMTLGVVPYALAVRLWADYDSAFTGVNCETNDGSRRRAKLALLLELGLRPRQGGSFRAYWARQIVATRTVREARGIIREYLRDQEQRATETAKARARLVSFAGVEGEDEDGRRLDQREFEETKGALQDLAGMQMGWYRNRGRRYRPGAIASTKRGWPADRSRHRTARRTGRPVLVGLATDDQRLVLCDRRRRTPT